jgi:hypothetical protein
MHLGGRIILAAWLAVFLFPHAACAAKEPIPNKAARDEATDLIREVYGEEVQQAKTAKQKIEVGQKLLDSALELTGDPAGKYVLIQAAKVMAKNAGDLDLAFSAISALDDSFEIRALSEKVDVFKDVSQAARDDEQRTTVAQAASELATAAADAGMYDDAKQIVTAGLTVARKLRDRDKELIANLAALEREMDGYLKEYEKVKTSLATLETQPTDAQANLIAGRFRCFFEGNWEDGVPMLALSDDSVLKAIALKELSAPEGGAKQAAIGDAWWDFSEQEKDSEVAAMALDRAGHWYGMAQGSLTGLAAKRVEKRIADIEEKQKEQANSGIGTRRKKPQLVDKWIASGDEDGVVLIWDVTTGKVEKTLSGHGSYVYTVDFSSDGKRLVAGGYRNPLKLWNVETGQQINQLSFGSKRSSSYIYAAKFSPDGNVIVSAPYSGRTVHFWNGNTGQPLRTMSAGRSDYIYCYDLAFSADGKGLVTVGSDDASIWNLSSGQRVRTIDHRSTVRCTDCSANGRYLVTGGYNSTINFYDAKNGAPIGSLKGHTDTVLSVDFSPDSKKLVSGSEDGTVKVWDVAKAKGLLNLTGHTTYVTSVKFSPSGKYIASGGRDNKVIVWDAATGKQVLQFTNHRDGVQSLAFAPAFSK